MAATGIQGHDSIPREVAGRFRKFLADYLPGWSVDGAYNFGAGPSSQMGAAWLDKLLHSGPHPWTNRTVTKLLRALKALPKSHVFPGGTTKTTRAAALLNFLHEANDIGNFAGGSKTGGFVAFSSRMITT